MLLNQSLPGDCGLYTPSQPEYAVELLQPQFHKHVPLGKALATFPIQAVKLLEYMSEFLEGGFRSTLVDLKVVDLKVDQCTCMPGWHIDTVVNPRHPSKSENHLIFTSIFGTEFVASPVVFSKEKDHFSQVIGQIPNDNVFTAESNRVYRYNRLHLHRGPVVTSDCRRVLVRITETDIIGK